MKDLFVTPETEHQFVGDIIVTDPCYFIPHDIWNSLINDFWFPAGEELDIAYAGTIYKSGIKILYSSTAHGDGDYPVRTRKGTSVHNNSTGVDAGMIAVITVEDVRKLNPEFNVDDKWYPRIDGFNGRVYVDGEGNFGGDLVVDTSETSETEREYDDEEDEDNRGYDDNEGFNFH